MTLSKICWTCKRKFPSQEALEKHETVSEVHRQNAQREQEACFHRRDTLRHSIIEARNEGKKIDNALEQTVLPQQDLLDKKNDLLKHIKLYEREYGWCQEKLERHREKQQSCSAVSEKSIELGPFEVTAGACTWQGSKEMQEDRFLLDTELTGANGERCVAYAVFDGHSGGLCADYLTEQLFPNVQKCISTKPMLNEEFLTQAVEEAFILTDDDFLNKAKAHQRLDGTTAVVAFMFEHNDGLRLLVANVGDSRCVMTQGKDKVIGCTSDHKPDRPDEHSRILGRGGVVQVMVGVARVFTPTPLNMNNRLLQWGLAVSRAFGDLPLKHPKTFGGPANISNLVSSTPEITSFSLTPGKDELLILACDGVWDVMTNEEAAQIAHIHFEAPCGNFRNQSEQCARGLVRDSFQRCSDDNLTALVVHLGAKTVEPAQKRAKKEKA